MAERSAFDFTDDLGSDPVARRYRTITPFDVRGADIDLRIAQAKRAEAQSDFELAQAQLNASLAPMKATQEIMGMMSGAVKARTEMQQQIRVQQDATGLIESLGNVKTLDDAVPFLNKFGFGFSDPIAGPMAETKVAELVRQATDNAQTPLDVDAISTKLPASILSNSLVQGILTNAKNVASTRQAVREKFAAAGPDIGAVPMTPTGAVDVTQAGLALAAYGGKEEREKEAKAEAEKRIDNIRQSYDIVSMRLAKAEALATPEEQLKPLRSLQDSLETQLLEYSKSLIPGAGMPPSDGTQPTGGTGKSDWTAPLIAQGITVPEARTPAAATTGVGGEAVVPTPTPTPSPITTPTDIKPENKTKTATELRAAKQKETALMEELNAMKEASGLAQQPWGIRQINEALSSENAAIRAKAEELRQAQLDINPLANADENNAQDVAAALELVYPEISGGGMAPKFDVGNPKDSRVMAAAMFLQKVRPEFLRMVASDPGVARGGLSFKEIDEIVRNQPTTTGKRTTRK